MCLRAALWLLVLCVGHPRGQADDVEFYFHNGSASPQKQLLKRLPCSCQSYTCGCCAGMSIQSYNFSQNACLNLTYDPYEFSITSNMLMNDNSMFTYTFTGIIGMKDTPYESGVFKVEIQISERYPFEPPCLRFVTPVYHPNVDVAGRICLDLLRLPPKGTWRPVVTLSGLLTSLQLLLTQPNPDDPLMADIADEYRFNRPEYIRKAKEWTRKYAFQNT